MCTSKISKLSIDRTMRKRRGDIVCRVPPKSIARRRIQNCIESQQWDSLRTAMTQNADLPTSQVIQENPKLLLLACKFDAPSDIIQKLVQINAELTQERDEDSHQTPLHILCQKPASQDRTKAIKILTERYPRASIIMDSNGNTPLHDLCKIPCNSAYAVSAIESVCLAGPAAMTMENHDDETPMEIFLLSQDAAMTVLGEVYQNEVLQVLNKTNIMYLSNFKSNIRGEMYRLQCCQQAVFAKRTSMTSSTTCSTIDDWSSNL